MRNKKGHNKRAKVGDFAMTLIMKFLFLGVAALFDDSHNKHLHDYTTSHIMMRCHCQFIVLLMTWNL